jgi:hypothetical protein
MVMAGPNKIIIDTDPVTMSLPQHPLQAIDSSSSASSSPRRRRRRRHRQ